MKRSSTSLVTKKKKKKLKNEIKFHIPKFIKKCNNLKNLSVSWDGGKCSALILLVECNLENYWENN